MCQATGVVEIGTYLSPQTEPMDECDAEPKPKEAKCYRHKQFQHVAHELGSMPLHRPIVAYGLAGANEASPRLVEPHQWLRIAFAMVLVDTV